MSARKLGKTTQGDRYLNREESWLSFNLRVLAAADDQSVPVAERAKFLAIFQSNLDEFFMVRVSGLIEQHETGVAEPTPDGLSPVEQLDRIRIAVLESHKSAADIWNKRLRQSLADAGQEIVRYCDLSPGEQSELDAYFREVVFLVCTPQMLSPNVTFPFIIGRSLNLAVVLEGDDGPRLAKIEVPPNLPRAVRVPGSSGKYVLLEEIIGSNLESIFPGVKVGSWHRFRLLRDADIEIRELEAADLIAQIEQSLRLRRLGDPVVMEVEEGFPEWCRQLLANNLALDDTDVYVQEHELGLDYLWEIHAQASPKAKYPSHTPYLPEDLGSWKGIFDAVSSHDVLVNHPFDSFRCVQSFVNSASEDARVIGIKQTLYRVGSESPVVEGLLQAAEKGRRVAAMVELKARFDEDNNLAWSRALERAGAHVTYGFAEMKTHAKMTLIVRKEAHGLRQYVHIGTGNYNPVTARMYTDLGLFTSDPDICTDVAELFNYLTGFSKQTDYRKLLVAPINLREQIIERIERETENVRNGNTGRILFKLNSLVDPEVIDALYEASQAGVEVRLVVRGICCLRPGVEGLSDNIQVVSVVGRFLEHSRIYYFENQGAPDVFIGSADMMRRNLDRRIEVLVPVTDSRHTAYLREVVIESALKDNQDAWHLNVDGSYEKQSAGMEKPFRSQSFQMDRPATSLIKAK